MNKEIIQKLKSLKPVLKEKFGIEEFAVFGSVARGDDTENSDIDIVIIKAKKKNYFDLLEVKYFLRDCLHKEIDIGYYDAIRPIFKKHINKDLINV
ncbi:nucleotidyltransferase family protein [Nautilia sp.]